VSGMKRAVHPQVTDAVTQTSAHVLGLGPAAAAINAYLGQAQAQSVLAANMVSQQQQQALASLTATVRNVGQLLSTRRGTALQAPRNASAIAQASFDAAPNQAPAEARPMYQPPVVT
jgi:hypothetical protein